MRILLFVSLLLIAAAPAPAQQRPEWLRQYRWTEVQGFQASISRYAARDRITEKVLNAVANALGASLRDTPLTKLVELIDRKSREAAQLKGELAAAKAAAQTLSNSPDRTMATDGFDQAMAAFEKGDLDGARDRLASITALRLSSSIEARKLWADAVQARAKLFDLVGETSLAAKTVRDARVEEARGSAEIQWSLLTEEVEYLQTEAVYKRNGQAAKDTLTLLREGLKALVPLMQKPWATGCQASGMIAEAQLVLVDWEGTAALPQAAEELKGFREDCGLSGTTALAKHAMALAAIFGADEKKEQARDQYLEAIRLAKTAGDKKIEHEANFLIANIYTDLGDYDEAARIYSGLLRVRTH